MVKWTYVGGDQSTRWTELADALRDATDPSRELDARLFCALNDLPYDECLVGPHFTDTDHIGQIIKVIGEKLPAGVWSCSRIINPKVSYACVNNGIISASSVRDNSSEVALTLCEAFCRSMALMEDGRGRSIG